MPHRYNELQGSPYLLEKVKSMPIDSQGQGTATPEDDSLDRRGAVDRRKQSLRALFYGSFNPRRRASRRNGERRVAGVDWHDPQWLAVAMLIVLFSCVDAFLTLTLIDHGAYEVNPLMAPLMGGSALAFAMVKIGLTAGGVVLLTILARMKVFGRVPVSLLLYTVLLGYGVLLVYEFRLLQEALPS
ncbi:MAG TPA: DUF5658 family protein [Steroidobacteraceae bacterium]|nr:DUF5658 family protein [Steroidobacteraceae bacterium]